jgi:hypothetical protein
MNPIASADGRRDACSYMPLLLWLVAFGLNLVAIAAVTGFDRLEWGTDEVEYFERAQLLWAKGRFEGLLRTPLWPGLLALLFSVTGPSVAAAKVLAALLCGLTAPGVYVLTWQLLADRRQAVIAGILTVLSPTLIYLNATINVDSFSAVGFIWTNVLLVHLIRRATIQAAGFRVRPLDWLLFGAVAAALLLVKPAFVPWLAMLLICGLYAYRRVLGPYILATSLALGAFCAVMAPWWARNYEISGGHFVPFTVAGSLSFAETNNPVIARMAPRVTIIDGRAVWTGPGSFLPQGEPMGLASEEELRGLTEYELARLLASRSQEWIIDHPGEWLLLVVKKIGFALGVWPLWIGGGKRLVAILSFLLVFALSVPGWIQFVRRPGYHRLLLLHPLCFFSIVVLFFGLRRYRAPFEPSFLIASSVAVSWLIQKWESPPTPPAGAYQTPTSGNTP